MQVARTLQRLHVKWFMVGYLACVLIIASFSLGQPSALARGLVMIAVYVAFDVGWTFFRDRKTYLPLSSGISGLILAIVLSPTAPWWTLIVIPALAVISKQLFRWQKRQVWNPAAFALVLVSFLVPSAISWWAVAWWGIIPKIIGILVGLLIVARIRRSHAAIGFLLVYILGLLGVLLTRGVSLQLLLPILFDGTLIFFVTVMLVEPVTTSYRTVRLRFWYGAIVGALAVLFPLFSVPLPDGFLPPLLLGNLVMAFVDRKKKTSVAPMRAPLPPSSSMQ